MKLDLKNLVPKERLDELGKSPEFLRLGELFAKVQSDTATPEERREFAEKTDWVHALPSNVLSEQHRPEAVS